MKKCYRDALDKYQQQQERLETELDEQNTQRFAPEHPYRDIFRNPLYISRHVMEMELRTLRTQLKHARYFRCPHCLHCLHTHVLRDAGDIQPERLVVGEKARGGSGRWRRSTGR